MRRRPVGSADEVVIAGLLEEHGAALLAYGTRLSGDRAGGEAVARTTVLRSWPDPRATAGAGTARAHLFAVAARVVAERRGSPVRAELLVDSGAVLAAVRALPSEMREVLHAVFFDGRGVAATAAELAVSEATVKARASAALRWLRDTLGGRPPSAGPELLGAYVLGLLDGDEWASMQAHLDDCASCRLAAAGLREMTAALGEIQPEALLDGPPPDATVLRDTFAEVRGARRRRARRRFLASALIVVAFLAAGIVAGRLTAPRPAAGSAASAAPGVRTGSVRNALTSATMTVVVQPAAGWVRVRATLDGLPPGEDCRLFVVSAAGARQQAASWVSATEPTTVDGSALMASAAVATVQAETYAGQILATVPI